MYEPRSGRLCRSGVNERLGPGPPMPCASQQPGTWIVTLSGSGVSGLNHFSSSPTPLGSVAKSQSPSRWIVARSGEAIGGLTTAGVGSRSAAGAAAWHRGDPAGTKTASTPINHHFICLLLSSNGSRLRRGRVHFSARRRWVGQGSR